MAECSQEFKYMLTSFYDEAYEDGEFQCDMSGPSREEEDAILQYVAQLEAIRDKAQGVARPLAADMTGGMP